MLSAHEAVNHVEPGIVAFYVWYINQTEQNMVPFSAVFTMDSNSELDEINNTSEALECYLDIVENERYSPTVEDISDFEDFQLSQVAENVENFEAHEDISDDALTQSVEEFEKTSPSNIPNSRFRTPLDNDEIDDLRSKQ